MKESEEKRKKRHDEGRGVEMVTLAREFDACGEVRLEIGGPHKYRVLTTEEIRSVVEALERGEQVADKESRRAFEAWVSAPPYEREIKRFYDDARKSAWPGNYRDIAVQLAWEAWQQGERSKERP